MSQFMQLSKTTCIIAFLACICVVRVFFYTISKEFLTYPLFIKRWALNAPNKQRFIVKFHSQLFYF